MHIDIDSAIRAKILELFLSRLLLCPSLLTLALGLALGLALALALALGLALGLGRFSGLCVIPFGCFSSTTNKKKLLSIIFCAKPAFHRRLLGHFSSAK